MHQFNEYAKHFFQKEKKRLLEAYPGVTLRRLQQEIRHYTLGDMMDESDLYIPSESNPVTNFFRQVESGIPLPYISGRSFFYKSEFIVNPDVLIPRFETEILVELAVTEVKKIKKDSKPRVLDMGTGSGAIIISLMQDCGRALDGMATDISEKALTVAKKNYFHLRYTLPRRSSLTFQCADRMSGIEQGWDLIVSNPPYIMENADRSGVNKQVDLHEPHNALYIPDQEYEEWFCSFFNQALAGLNVGGCLIMEGHEGHLEDLAGIAKALGFSGVNLIKDYTDRQRFLIARKK